MELGEVLEALDFRPNEAQIKAIKKTEGPVLIIAGPGSGKTQTIVARTLNLLLVKGVSPDNIVVCTFTEKSAATLKDRLRQALVALNLETKVDLQDLWMGTIHSICHDILLEHLDDLDDTSLALTKGFEVLDGLTQELFLREHVYDIFTRNLNTTYGGGKWRAIRKATQFMNSITEELIDDERLRKSRDEKIARIGRQYERYEKELHDANSVDFAHLQSLVFELLTKSDVGDELRSRLRYVMVDEYQDTNYVQERIFLELTRNSRNLCVVGDDDQALYRFRGATVQNILQFKDKFEKLKPIVLDKNYRSTPEIIDFVNRFIKDGNWAGTSGEKYRYGKTIVSTRGGLRRGSPSVVKISEDDGTKVAQLISGLLRSGAVEDPNQIAILFKSVAYDAGGVMEALEEANIDYYAPRARGFFELDHVMALLGAILDVFSHLDDADRWSDSLYGYYDECYAEYQSLRSNELRERVRTIKDWLATPGDKPKMGLVDITYRILGAEPFSTWREDEVLGHDFAIMTDLLSKFQDYYHSTLVFKNSRDHVLKLRQNLFNSYLFMLWSRGMEEYEDPHQIFPKGKVQIMTIHQAKGLEFPVVLVGSLHKNIKEQHLPEEVLGRFMERQQYEPRSLVPTFDFYRQFYVAFSRAMDLLVVFWDREPNKIFDKVLTSVPELDRTAVKNLRKEKMKVSKTLPVKPEYSLTGHIHMYDVCPRQYMFLNKFKYAPSLSAQFQFGTLVHRTIEDVHNHVLKGKGVPTVSQIDNYFDRNAMSMQRHGKHPIAPIFIEMARKQVRDYVANSGDSLHDIINAEVPVVVQKKNYVLTGVVDVIKGRDGQPELLDFKASQRAKGQEHLEKYRLQLAIYAKMVELKLDIKPVRFKIYWTAEENAATRVQELNIGARDIVAAERHFEEVVGKIEDGNFTVPKKPSRDTCRNCDFRFGCESCSSSQDRI